MSFLFVCLFFFFMVVVVFWGEEEGVPKPDLILKSLVFKLPFAPLWLRGAPHFGRKVRPGDWSKNHNMVKQLRNCVGGMVLCHISY